MSVLKHTEVSLPVAKLTGKLAITEQTHSRWKAKYAGLEVGQIRQSKQLRDENTWLQQLVAQLSLDKTTLQDVLGKEL